jgi:hypothetical protein
MLGTLLDVGDTSATAFARECVSLALAGVRERARTNAGTTFAGMVSGTLRWAAILWIALNLAGISGDALAYPAGVRGIVLWLLLLWPVLALALLGYDRRAGLCGIAWVASLQTPIALGPYPNLFAGSLVPLVGFVAMLIAPRRKPHDPRQLAWLFPAIAISLIHGHGPGLLGFGFCPLAIPALALISLAGILILEIDPRLAIASSLVWASIGLMSAEEAILSDSPMNATVLLLACAPIAILIASAHRRTRTTGT